MDDKRVRFEAQALPHLDAAHNLARWLVRSPADVVEGGDVKPWLLAIVRNCFLTAARRAQERKIIPLMDERAGADETDYADDAPDPETAAMRADQSRKLNGLIAGLPQEFREVIVLREMEDLSYREIAEIVAVPIGTVMSRLARGRALLKERWNRNVEGGRHAMR